MRSFKLEKSKGGIPTKLLISPLLIHLGDENATNRMLGQ